MLHQLIMSIPFNDEELLEKKVKENWGDIACIIVEPLLGNCASTMPKPGYLELIRSLCDKHGIVMIFDEVKTGFRIAKGGAQEYFNIKADLVTYAKALALTREHLKEFPRDAFVLNPSCGVFGTIGFSGRPVSGSRLIELIMGGLSTIE